MISKVRKLCSSYPARAASYAGLYQMLFSAFGAAISIPFVISSLSVNAAGMWFSLQGIIAIFLLSDFGFSMVISRQVSHSFKLDRDVVLMDSDLIETESGWNGVSELYAASKVIFTRVTIASILLFIISYEIVLPHTNILVSNTNETKIVWYLLAASFCFIFQARLSQSFLDGLGYMYLTRIVSGSNQLFSSFLSVISLLLGYGIVGLAFVLLVSSIIQFCIMHLSLKLIASGQLVPIYRNTRILIKGIWKVAIPFGLVISGTYLVSAAQVPIVGVILGPAEVTSIYIAFKISQFLNGSVLQVITAQLPFFTKLCANGQWAPARKIMLETLVIGATVQIFIGLFLFFISPTLVDMWVGPGHYIKGSVLLVFSINYVATCLSALPTQFVLAAGRNPFALCSVIHGVLIIGGIILLCPSLGLLGVPLANLIAVLLTNFWLNPKEGMLTWQKINEMNRG